MLPIPGGCINKLMWTVSVCPSLSVTDMTRPDTVSFPWFELGSCYVNSTRAPRIFLSVQLALCASDPLTQTNMTTTAPVYGHTCTPARASMNHTQYLGRIAWRPLTTIGDPRVSLNPT